MVMERVKFLTYTSEIVNLYFWRTYSQQEIELVEERGERLTGIEFKWSPNKVVKVPSEWAHAYPEAGHTVITPENYRDLVLP